ncbi:MAG TPA: purine-nucleoside phosphorylase [Candidatus Eremiobacteraceae bacterium]|nr:purine-nucleoside phosphorylase [Candidatus Eremiobacteraceae bacterium]
MSSLTHNVTLNVNFISKHTRLKPKISVILGSGLGGLADSLTDAVAFGYHELPHFPATTVAGHRGRLIVGRLEGRPVALFDGRIHFYEGHPMWQVAFPVYVAHKMGATALIVTNAAGGINPAFSPGTIMLIRDHINLTGTSPLIGPNAPELGPRFPSMRDAYDSGLRESARRVAAAAGIAVAEGVYVAMIGPQYETDAELRMLAHLGADAVGMSTVPEVIAARHAGMRSLGISVIANAAVPDASTCGHLEEPTHESVQEVVRGASGDVLALVRGVVGALEG